MSVLRSQINSPINDAELRQVWDLIDLRPTARWAILAMKISSAIRLFLAYVLDWEQSRYLSAASLMGLWLSSRGRPKLGLITALTAILCTCALSAYISYSGRDRWPWLCPRGCARRRQGCCRAGIASPNCRGVARLRGALISRRLRQQRRDLGLAPGAAKAVLSNRWKAMFGYAPHELEDNIATWGRMLHPDDLAGATA